MQKSVVFMGSGKFAVESLKSLQNSEQIKLVAVVTQKDKPVGRKRVLTPTFVRQFCLENQILNFQAENSTEILALADEYKWEFDFLVVADYGVILKQAVLDLANLASLNVHGSLLPSYRGASPVHSALLNNDKVTGVSIISMTSELDAGPVWLKSEIEIDDLDDYETLLLKLGKLGGKSILKVLLDYETLTPLAQDSSLVTFSKKIEKQDGLIVFEATTLSKVLGKFRAFKLWPGIFFVHQNLKFQIIECEKVDISLPVNLLLESNGNLFYGFKDGVLKITKIKPESKSEMLVSDFIRGNPTFFSKHED